MQFVDGGNGLSEIGVTILPMSTRLLREPVVWIPLLLREARALLHYCLGARPPVMLLRRYARAVRITSRRNPLALPASVLRCPWMLRFVEPLPRGGSVLSQRADLATRLAENCSVGVGRFFAYRGSRLRMLSSIVLQMSLDFLAVPFRLLARHR